MFIQNNDLPSPVVCIFSRSAFTDRSQTVCDVCTWQAAWDRRQVSRMMYKTGRCGQKDQTINLPVICLFLFIFCFFQLWPHAKRAFGEGSRWKRCLEAGGDIFTRDSDMCVFSTERRRVCWRWLRAVSREGVWMGRTEKNTDGFCSQRLQRYQTQTLHSN